MKTADTIEEILMSFIDTYVEQADNVDDLHKIKKYFIKLISLYNKFLHTQSDDNWNAFINHAEKHIL